MELKKDECQKWAELHSPAPAKVSQYKRKNIPLIDAEFANEVIEIQREFLILQQKVEAIEPGFDPEAWLSEMGFP